jgi:two-component system, OmpR family, phosphate regulon sensor histidine kinase PhoR
MRHRSLVRATLAPLLIILLAMLALVTALGGGAARSFYLQRQREHLEQVVAVVSPRVLAVAVAPAAVQDLCREMNRETGLRFTVIGADGGVLGDSLERPAHMDNHHDRPEVVTALAGGTGSSLRFSATRNERLLYVARLADDGAGTRVVVRAAVSLATLDRQLRTVYGRTILAGLVVTALAGIAAWLRTRALARTLQRVRDGAEAFAAGDLGGRLTAADTEEFAALTEAMNRMANQLGERFATIERQRGELEAVLSSMTEGVVAVDDDENVIGLNTAAARLLGVETARALGRSIQEVGRHPELTLAVQAILAGREHLERDVSLGLPGETCLQVRASALSSADGRRIGALLVLNNVTRLRRLETMRRDFVANVSHELKTPITSIKGFVETILDDPPADEAELRRFLEIVGRQSDRLDSIITDLLALSRLEQDSESGGIELLETALLPFLDRVVRDLVARRPEAAARVRVECGADLRARLNAPLVEQAVTNLLENALKYSPAGTPVAVRCDADGGMVRVSVTDEGPGIAAEHLPRLFERFYRVDKARSRQLGGTGLGLAIVKHIAQAHGGRAEVSSEVGRGSTFTLVLPGAEKP